MLNTVQRPASDEQHLDIISVLLLRRVYYKKLPRGYEADHPNAEFLLYNGLTARIEEKVPDSFFSGAIIDYAYSHYRNMLPLHRWLKKALKKGDKNDN